MKKIISVLVILLVFASLLTSCSASVDAPEVSTTPDSAPTSLDAEVITSPEVIIDVFDTYYGQYCLMSEVKFEHYDDDGIPEYIWVENPALLAFQVGNEFEGGLGTVEGTSVEYMISHIQEYVDTHELEYDDQQMFEEILNILNNIVVVTGAST